MLTLMPERQHMLTRMEPVVRPAPREAMMFECFTQEARTLVALASGTGW